MGEEMGRRIQVIISKYVLLIPAVAWSAVFVIGPILTLFLTSLYTRSGAGWTTEITFANYEFVFNKGLEMILHSVELSAVTTIICFIAGYPVAYFLVFKVQNSGYRTILLISVFVPFYINWIIRTIAWIPLFGRMGLLNNLLMVVGVIGEPSDLFLFSIGPMLFVMIISYTAFMICTVFLSMIQINPQLVEAAHSLGANPIKTHYHVILRQSLPGAIAGAIFIFAVSFGDFATPQIIGGGMFSVVPIVVMMFIKNLNWPLAAAFSSVGLAITLAAVYLMIKIADITELIK